jgi:hypothetical protein
VAYSRDWQRYPNQRNVYTGTINTKIKGGVKADRKQEIIAVFFPSDRSTPRPGLKLAGPVKNIRFCGAFFVFGGIG